MNSYINIAIDGPSGAGKTTMARRLARELGFILVDTGAMYRSIGLYIYEQKIEPGDEAAVTAALPNIHIDVRYDEDGAQHMILNGRDVSDQIREPVVSMYASGVSALGPVRAFLLQMQRELARTHNVIMDGRDIGTVILPQAQVKFFLTASDETRARRRLEQLRSKGLDPRWEDVYAELIQRDQQDSSRDISPLRPAEDSILVDSSETSEEETLALMLGVIKEKIGI